MSQITTHVLDTAYGCPAVDVPVALFDEEGVKIATGRTDDDGRIGVLGPNHLRPGIYRLSFDTGEYFARTNRKTFFPIVTIDFTVPETNIDPVQNYHVPLLISPFAFSTYRGS